MRGSASPRDRPDRGDFTSTQIEADRDAQGPAAAAKLQRDGPETVQAFQGLDGRPVRFLVPGRPTHLQLLEVTVRQEDEGQGGAAFPPLAPGLIRVALMALDRPLEVGEVGPAVEPPLSLVAVEPRGPACPP